MMAPAKKSTRSSRITIACNSCRYRKQKCSGNKPVCDQCSQHCRQCDWPEQLKRGPEKGCIESLEIRLRETENLLLKTLSQLSDDQLSIALTQGSSGGDLRSNNERLASPFTCPSKRGNEYWRKFPLDTVQNVRDWQQDRVIPESHRSTSNDAVSVKSRVTSTPTPLGPPKRRKAKSTLSEEDDGLYASELDHSYLSLNTPLPPTVEKELPFVRQQSQATNVQHREMHISPDIDASLPIEEAYDMNEVPAEETHGLSPSKQQEPNSWSGAPSATFQKHFLW